MRVRLTANRHEGEKEKRERDYKDDSERGIQRAWTWVEPQILDQFLIWIVPVGDDGFHR